MNKAKIDKSEFNPFLAIQNIIDSSQVYLYLKELDHPSPGIKINMHSNQMFPSKYHAIFIADKKLTSLKQLVEPDSIKLWSTIGLADSAGNNRNLSTDTCAMIASILTFSGSEVFVNNKLFNPSVIFSDKD